MQTMIEKAYKKLKAAVYYDKTLLSLRDKIVEFEDKRNSNISDNENIDNKLQKIYSVLSCADNDVWEKYQKKILDSIHILAYPKKVGVSVQNKDKNDEIIYFNNIDCKKINIEKYQYFLDINVIGQILGVLWILLIGRRLDSKNLMYEHSYGNRLRKKLVDGNNENNTDSIISYSPVLFEPYFSQYESWRDKGLEIAKKYVDAGDDIVTLTIDFRSFFYSVDYNEEEFNEFLKFCRKDVQYDDYESVFQRVNTFVYKVIETYSKQFRSLKDTKIKLSNRENYNLLPIGFFPSNILANWRLNTFDKQILDRWNPLYYGRYVDDIIIVDKIDKKSGLYEKIADGNCKSSDVFDYYLGLCNADKVCDCINNKALFKKSTEKDENNKEKTIYYINKEYINNNDSKIIVQNNKVKVFYFHAHVTGAVISCFQKEIAKNASGFMNLPEFGESYELIEDIGVFDINRDDTINKFSSITEVKIDRFNLSKNIGKAAFISSMVNDEHLSKRCIKLINSLSNIVLIDNFRIWERLFELLIIQKNYDEFYKLVSRIIDAVNEIRNQNTGEIGEKCYDSLLKHFYSSLYKVLALVWGKDPKDCINKIIEKLNNPQIDYENIIKYRRAYLHSRMINRHLIPICLELTKFSSDKFADDSDRVMNNICLFELLNGINIIEYFNDDIQDVYKYYPCIAKMQDILFTLNISFEEDTFDIEIIREKAILFYYYLNYNYTITCQNTILHSLLSIKVNENIGNIHINNKKKDKLKIAVANIKVEKEDFIAVLEKSSENNRGLKKYEHLAKVLNEAKREKVDMLILPESYVPRKWIHRLAGFSANNQMAIITGVEHFITCLNDNQQYVNNYTAVILPYEIDDYKYAFIGWHNKVYYSPEEKRQITGYNYKFKEGKMLEMYYWSGIYFPVFCCFELASIANRARFQGYADLFIAIEWNKDTNYYSSIVESLCRDIHCYCVQVNSSDYGDSRIVQPTNSARLNIIRTKGGINSTILVDTIDIEKLRKHQIKGYELQKDENEFKPTPPGFNKELVWKKLKGEKILLM